MAARGGKASKLAKQSFELSARQLRVFVDKEGVAESKAFLRELRTELRGRLFAAGGSASTTATALQIKAMLAQVEGLLTLKGRLIEKSLKNASKTAAQLGGQHAVNEFKLLETHFSGTTPVLGLDRAAVFRGLVNNVVSSRLRSQARSLQTWGLQTVNKIEQFMGLATATGMPVEKMVQGIVGKAGILPSEVWKAERIVRTELMYAHGAAKQQAIAETAKEFSEAGDPVLKKLIETFDDRTGSDSYVIHGQTVPADKPFEYKQRSKGGWRLVKFMHPPNRPNDRAVVIPWRRSWDETATFEQPLTLQQLRSAAANRFRKAPGVPVPPGHKPGQPYSYSV